MRRLTDVASNDNDDLLEGLTRRSIVVARPPSDGGSFDALERSLLQTSNEVVRRALESVLQEFASDDAGVVEVSGSRYRRHQKAAMEYHSRAERFALSGGLIDSSECGMGPRSCRLNCRQV